MRLFRPPMTRQRLGIVAACALVAAAGSWAPHRSEACDTPVYRYAMYRWQPAPYEVYYFYRGETPEPRAAIHDELRELPYAKRPGNVAFIDVDVADQAAFARLPSAIRDHWKSISSGDAKGTQGTPPKYVVLTPQGKLVWRGELDVQELSAIAESPGRSKLAQELGAGKVGAMILLKGDETGQGEEAEAASKANKDARAAVTEAIRKVATGQYQLTGFGKADDSPNGAARKPPLETADSFQSNRPASDDASSAKSEAAGPEIGFVELDRSDPQEQWFIRSLLAVESDLSDANFRRQPMVFITYGRGRALPPFVGNGIRADNLIVDIEFISGACSCTVKGQNPGADLLIRHDWEAAAKTLADRFGSEEGNESQLDVADYFPSLAIPPSGDERVVKSSDHPDAKSEPKSVVPEISRRPGSDETTPSQNTPAADRVASETVAGTPPASPDLQVASSTAKPPKSPTDLEVPSAATAGQASTTAASPSNVASQIAWRSLFFVGGLMILVLGSLAVVTFVLLRSN